MKITREQACRFLVGRQRYRAQGSPWQGQEGVAQAIDFLGAVQIDPINVYERNHHHVLFTRVHGYRPEMLDAELYVHRSAFESWCNALCVLPMEHYPYLAYKMQLIRARYMPTPEVLAAAHKVMRAISDNGPSASRDFATSTKVHGWWDGAVSKTKAEKAALDYLHYTGQVMIASRDGQHRRYDLPERVVPAPLLAQEVNEADYRRFMLERFLIAYGLSQTSLFRFGWLETPKSNAVRLLKSLVDQGEAISIQIEGVKRQYFCHASLLPELENPQSLSHDTAVFVAPLDNLLWDRDRLEDFFGFHYRWEVYVPAAKRVYGYYVVPVLLGSSLVGRIELKAHRPQGLLEIKNLWLEVDTARVRQAVTAAAADLAGYLGCRVISTTSSATRS